MITIENEGNKIIYFGRDKNKTLYKMEDDTFKPYFYYQDNKGKFTSIFGDKCKKITCKNPKDIPKLRQKYSKTFEADIIYTNRYMIDNFDKINKEPIRICYIDIEIDATKGLPQPQNPTARIYSISCYDTFNEEMKTFINDDEKILLNEFLNFIEKTDPDLLVAWYGDSFDFPYIINRINRLKLPLNKLTRWGTTYSIFEKGRFNNKIGGRVLIDLLWAYRKLTQGQGRESFALEYVSQYELGEGKEKYKGTLDDLYTNDKKKFIEYNQKDVELLKLLDRKLRIIEFLDEQRRYARCKWEDTYRNSKIINNLILCFCKNKVVLPTKQKWESGESFKGAFVYQPDKGLFENIAVADLISLYPSLIITFNLSPETFIDKSETGCINIDDKFFYKRQKGIIPLIIEKLFIERKHYKDLMKNSKYGSIEYNSYDMLQTSVKVLMNSIYGVLGHVGFRLYKKEIAETITYLGRKTIKHVNKVLDKNGFKVIYGDTDSTFFKIEDIKDGEKAKDLINQGLIDYSKSFGLELSKLEINFEKVFGTIFFSGAKKRYVGKLKWLNGKEVDDILIVGFESKRSDSPQVIRNFQKEVFKLILNKSDESIVTKYILEFIDKFKTLKEEIGIPIGVTKELDSYKNVPIHIRACRLSNKRHGTKFKSGDKIKYVYVNKVPERFEFENVIAFKDNIWKGYEIDYDRMIERLIRMKVETIYDSLGWDLEFMKQYCITYNRKKYINDNSKNLFEFKEEIIGNGDFE